ncbi:MAG: response regulator [Verrucomicrobiia bacterium]|jgi:DNA-binding NtrC family response regulator
MASSNCRPKPCILAIDDEEEFLSFLTELLECQGYRVIAVSTPTEAIQIYKERWREINVVLLDFLMPQMTGDYVFDELQRLNPEVRVVLVTGYEKSVPFGMFQKGLLGSLRKPFSLTDLVGKVEDALNAPAVSVATSTNACHVN